jgi:NAD(P)-dependent dehydrogenase (short-subunit alcohol dehydrogenase family)
MAKSLETHLCNDEYDVSFFGRTNPFKLKNFIAYAGIHDESSVKALSQIIVKDLEDSSELEMASLVVLSGVSSNDWMESFFVNEYLPAKVSEDFAQTISKLAIKGSITLISSSAAYQGAKLAYSTTKASLTGIVHSISRDFKNIVRINLILPSAFESGMIADWDDQKRAAVANGNYIGRLGSADDMTDAVIFTINNNFITNSIINMTGGTVHI